MKKDKNDNEKLLSEDTLGEEARPEGEAQPPTESDVPVGESDSPEEVEESLQEETIPEEAEDLHTILEESQKKADEYLDGWQRARAEFANYKKRVAKERQRAYQNAAGDILMKYLPVVDDLERALKNSPEEGQGAEWAEGVELIYRKMMNILEAQGVTPMNAEGKSFDPNLHEAIVKTENDEDEYESEQIIEVLERGYLLGDRVLRPAKVRIAA